MRCRVGKGAPAHTEPQSRSTARAPCPRVRPVFTLSPDTWARRHARAFVTSALWAGAHSPSKTGVERPAGPPSNDRIRAKPALGRGFLGWKLALLNSMLDRRRRGWLRSIVHELNCS